MNYPLTEEVIDALELEIPKYHGSLVAACRALAVNYTHLALWCTREPEVATRIKAAQQIGYASIEDVAIMRATTGITEDIYYQGEVVGQKQVTSDALMNTILKARVPGYNPDTTHNHNHMVNVQIMPRANTYEEWLEQATATTIEGSFKEPEPCPTPTSSTRMSLSDNSASTSYKSLDMRGTDTSENWGTETKQTPTTPGVLRDCL